MKIIFVAGARPNFMKIAPILRETKKHKNIDAVLVHTGQHYDENMSSSFFNDLGIKKPDYNLNCGGGSHAEQTANIMVSFEKVCIRENPDIVTVVGDINSTISAGLVTKKLNIKLAHIEAGLRSFDRSMPEEINRLATDSITDIFFTTEEAGTINLINEGHNKDKIHFVGHVMIDNLYFQLDQLNRVVISRNVKCLKKALPEKYFCLTMHRPGNVDNEVSLKRLIIALREISNQVPIVFPCHPRTRNKINSLELESVFSIYSGEKDINNGLYLFEPLGYNDFLYLWKDCTAMLTDSGGLQEETTALNIPCITLRSNTERPVTVDKGSNILVGNDINLLSENIKKVMSGRFKKGLVPEFWDGKSSARIIKILKKLANQ